MLRDNILFVDLSVYGSFDYTQGLVLYENRSQRTSWIFGGFHFVQQNIDRLDESLAYFQRDFGLLSALRYPLDRFRRVEAELTLGGVQRYCLTDFSGEVLTGCEGVRTGDPSSPYADPGAPTDANAQSANWRGQNGGVNFTISPTLRYGYDTVRYDLATGPVAGSSLVLELGGGYLPGRGAVHGFLRADAQKYWQLLGRSNLMLRFAGGTTFSPNEKSEVWERSWWLTSADNLRGFYPLDLEYLIGQHYYVLNAELQFPLDPLVRLLIFDYMEGVAALDFGSVFNRFESRTNELGQVVDPGAWDSRTLTGVLGVNVLFGPLLLRVHFGRPFDIGGLQTPAIRDNARWVTNITLRYFFF
jgi:outer membrane protein assembly factor BamA